MDVSVEVRDVFMVILEEKEIFEFVTVSANVIDDLVASEVMRVSVIVV